MPSAVLIVVLGITACLPARAAKVIVDIVRLDQPLLRLLLGVGAVNSGRAGVQCPG